MAISWSFFDILSSHGSFRRGAGLLDIGTSNIYGVPADGLVDFLRRSGCEITPEVTDFAREIEVGSGRRSDGHAINGAWLGQVLHAIGMRYDSIDSAPGYYTRLVDLNQHALPFDMVDGFDTVLNCGTTAHLLNQYNVLKCMHEAACVGGLMVHQVPASGHTDQGYYGYTARLFFDIAGNNGYELVDFWLDGPDGHDTLFAAVGSYTSVFPKLRATLDRIGAAPRETAIAAMQIPNVSINVIFRKDRDAPFRGTSG